MKLLYLEEVDSTNKYAKEHIKEIEDKTVIFTSHQTAGRGRLNRKWDYTGEDNIYASLVLKPSEYMQEIYSNLTQYLCVILCKTFEEYGVRPRIKWPNDIKIDGKKISGILAEGCIESGKLQGLVIGFGINLNTKLEELSKINQPATSLNIEIGRFVDKEFFLKKLLDEFCIMYDEFLEKGFILIKNDYIKRIDFINKEISVKVFDKTISGKVLEITDCGALKLVDNVNCEHTLLIGDIL